MSQGEVPPDPRTDDSVVLYPHGGEREWSTVTHDDWKRPLGVRMVRADAEHKPSANNDADISPELILEAGERLVGYMEGQQVCFCCGEALTVDRPQRGHLPECGYERFRAALFLVLPSSGSGRGTGK